VRISYASDPVYEVEDAKEMLCCLGLRPRVEPELIACPTCGRIETLDIRHKAICPERLGQVDLIKLVALDTPRPPSANRRVATPAARVRRVQGGRRAHAAGGHQDAGQGGRHGLRGRTLTRRTPQAACIAQRRGYGRGASRINGPGEAEGADVAVFAGKGRGIIYVQGEQTRPGLAAGAGGAPPPRGGSGKAGGGVSRITESEMLDALFDESVKLAERVERGENP